MGTSVSSGGASVSSMCVSVGHPMFSGMTVSSGHISTVGQDLTRSPGCSGIHHVAQPGLNPLMILIPQLMGLGGAADVAGRSLLFGNWFKSISFLLMILPIPFLSSFLSCLDFLLNVIASLMVMQ